MSTFYSINDYTGDGVTATYAVNFTGGFISRDHVDITLDEVATTAFTWDTDSQITFDSPPADQVAIRIQRNTPQTALVDFVNTAILTEEDLDLLTTQTIMINQETRDITSDDLIDAIADAQASAAAALVSETNAAASAAAALVSQNAAAASALASSSSASDSAASAAAALVSENASAASAAAALVSENASAASAAAALVSEGNAAASAASVVGAIATHAAITSGVHGISAFGATLVDDADAATARTTLSVDSSAEVDTKIGTVPTTAKTTPVDADVVTLWDSVATFAKKKVTWANVKATLLAYFQGFFSNPNILINTNGANPVNQREVTNGDALTSGDYPVDRWTTFLTGATNARITAGTAFGLTSNSAANGCYIFQRIESMIGSLGGKTVTVTMRVRSDVGATVYINDNGSITDGDSHDGDGDWQTLTVTKTLQATPTENIIGLYATGMAATEYFEIAWAKLEEGPVATPWTVPDPQQELARCQRYYRTVGRGMLGTWISATSVEMSESWSGNPMRANPSLSLVTSSPSLKEPGVAVRAGTGSTLAASTSSLYGIQDATIDGFTGANAGTNAVSAVDVLIACSAEL